MRYVIVGGSATEEVSGELLLCDESGSAVHRLSGDARRYFERVRDGESELPADDVTAALVAAKVIAPSVDVNEGAAADAPVSSATPVDILSRRRAMALGAAAVAAAGVVTVGLPSAAAAQSPGPAPAPEDPTYPVAPTEGTPPGTNWIDSVGIQSLDGVRSTNVTWETSPEPGAPGVTFNWRLYSPGNPSLPSNLIAVGGPATGSTPYIEVPGAIAGQSILWMLTAVGGESIAATRTFR